MTAVENALKTDSWTKHPFRLLFKVLTTALFIMYIGGGVGATAMLVQKKIYKAEPIEEVYRYINEEDDTGHFADLLMWLGARPLAETDKLVGLITPRSTEVSPAIFFEIFRREMKLNRPEEALFWLHLARYRLWYDLIRCKNGDEGVKTFDQMLDIFAVQQMTVLMQQHPELLKKSVQRVLDFDAKYPADDDPSQICKFFSPDPPVPANTWASYRGALRRKTEAALKEMDAAPAPVPATAVKKPADKKSSGAQSKAPEKTKSP